MRPSHDLHGYPSVGLRRNGKTYTGQRVHVLVLTAFIGPRPAGMVSRHLNDIPTDNRLENLAWGTQKDNLEDSRRNGGMLLGDRCPVSILTSSIVAEMRKLYLTGMSFTKIAAQFQTSCNNACSAIRGETWGHIPGAIPLRTDDRLPARVRGEEQHHAKLTQDDIVKIRKRYDGGGISMSQLGLQYGVHATAICKIVKRQAWKHIR